MPHLGLREERLHPDLALAHGLLVGLGGVVPAHLLEIVGIERAMHDPAVVAPRAGGFDGAGIADRGVGPVDDFFLGVLGLPTWHALSLRAMVHVALRVVGELALVEEGR